MGDGVAPLRVTVSFALMGEDGLDAEDLMRVADQRLHRAKRSRLASA